MNDKFVLYIRHLHSSICRSKWVKLFHGCYQVGKLSPVCLDETWQVMLQHFLKEAYTHQVTVKSFPKVFLRNVMYFSLATAKLQKRIPYMVEYKAGIKNELFKQVLKNELFGLFTSLCLWYIIKVLTDACMYAYQWKFKSINSFVSQ